MAQTYRRDANDDNDFDERGILKDGRRLRVPLMMMDGLDDVERAIMLDAAARRLGLSNGNDLRKPGHRYTTDSRALEAKERAYRERDEADAEAWRGNPPQTPVPASLGARRRAIFVRCEASTFPTTSAAPAICGCAMVVWCACPTSRSRQGSTITR
jgi:hypothetical protein